jgi:hypothetical protein
MYQFLAKKHPKITIIYTFKLMVQNNSSTCRRNWKEIVLKQMDILEVNDHPREVGGDSGQLWPLGSQLEVRRARFKSLGQRHFLGTLGGRRAGHGPVAKAKAFRIPISLQPQSFILQKKLEIKHIPCFLPLWRNSSFISP